MGATLHGQAGLITGAGRGAGRVMAERLAADGMAVTLVSRTSTEIESVASEIRDRGGAAQAVTADVLDRAALSDATERTVERWGRLDLLVNNAGLLKAVGTTWTVDPDDWARDLQVNVLGVYHGCRAAVPVMESAGRGRIVNLVGGGVNDPFPHASAYATSKAAVMRLTESLAAELTAAASPVRVIAMTPGLVRTGMTTPTLESDERRRWQPLIAEWLDQGKDVPPDLAAGLVAAVATGRLDAFHGRMLSAPHDEDLTALDAEAASLDPDDPQRQLRIHGRPYA
jgi:NAD(P)-dependent dehydrogenase (short-subunit alcohol dehydrogenase family)